MVPRPHFFIVRPDVNRRTSQGQVHTIPGAIVPLIPVDELPDCIDIIGVPRELSAEQTVGLCNLGTVSKSNGSYAVKVIRQGSVASTSAGKLTATQPAIKTAAGPGQAAPSPLASGPPAPATVTTPAQSPSIPAHIHPPERIQPHGSDAPARPGRHAGLDHSIHNNPYPPAPPTATAATAASPGRTDPPEHQQQQQAQQQQQTRQQEHQQPQPQPQPQPLSAAPAEYCRHWCLYGSCRWGARCRYLHAMPIAPDQLAAGMMGMMGASASASASAGGGSGSGKKKFGPWPRSSPSSSSQVRQLRQTVALLRELGLMGGSGSGSGGGGGDFLDPATTQPRKTREVAPSGKQGPVGKAKNASGAAGVKGVGGKEAVSRAAGCADGERAPPPSGHVPAGGGTGAEHIQRAAQNTGVGVQGPRTAAVVAPQKVQKLVDV